MRLVLAVVGENAGTLGRDARKAFGPEGGSVGRGGSSAWRLPDPTNTLSANHALIAHNGLGFTITDTSTNGVYINTVDAPLGRGNTAALSEGDIVYVADYVISVSIEHDASDQRQRLGLQGSAAVRAGSPGRRPDAQDAAFGAPGAAMNNPGRLPPDLPLWDGLQGLPPPPAAPRAAPASRGGDPLADLGREGPSRERDEDLLSPPKAAQPFMSREARSPLPAEPWPPAPAPGFGPLDSPATARALGTNAWPDAFPLSGATPGDRPQAAAPPPRQLIPPGIDALLPPAANAFAPKPAAPMSVAPAPAKIPDSAKVIPDDLDFSDLLGGLGAPAAAKPPAPRPALPPDPGPISQFSAAPVPPPPAMPLLPPAALPEAPSRAPASPLRPPLSPMLANDLVALRDPGVAAPMPGDRVLDPLAVLKQRAAERSPAPSARPAMDASAGPAMPSGESDDLRTFWNALGIDPQSIPPERRHEVLAELGRALREMAEGLHSVLAARTMVKSEFQIEQTRIQSSDNNPFKFLRNGEEALRKTLANERGFLSLPRAVRDGFHDIKAHEVAAMVAMRAVIGNVLTRVSPPAIETDDTTSGLFSRRPDKAKLWDRFVEMHAAMVNDMDRTTRVFIAEEFSRTYDEQVAKLRRGEGK